MKKTMEKAHQKMLQDTSEEKYRVKLYKAGRLWLAAGMMTLAFGLVSVTGQVRVSADDTTPTTSTESSASSDQASSAADSDSSTVSAASASTSATDSSQTETSSTESSTGETASETQTSAAETTETGTTTKDASKTTTDTAKTATADSSAATTASVTTDEKTADESTAADATTGAKTVTDSSPSTAETTDNDASNAEVAPESTATTINPNQSQTVNETHLGVADDTAVSAAKQLASDAYTTTGVAQVVTAQLAAAEDTDTNDADGTDDAANTGVITTQNGVEYQGFSVTDPTYPDGVKTIPNSDDYLYTEIAYGTAGNYTSYVALSTDRATASQTNVTVMDADGNVVSTKSLTESATSVAITADGASGLSITDNQDTVSINSSNDFYILTNVLGELNGYTKDGALASTDGVVVFKPEVLTQVTTFVKEDGTEVDPAYSQSGLSGQAYTTGTPVVEPTGYTADGSSNESGYMSPFTPGSSVTLGIYYTTVKVTTIGGVNVAKGARVEDLVTLTFNSDGSAKMSIEYGANLTQVPSTWISAESKTYTLSDGGSQDFTYDPTDDKDNSSYQALIAHAGSYNVANPYLPQTANVSYTYTANPETVTVNYVNQNGTVIAPATTVSGTYDETSDITIPAIAGYTADTDNSTAYTVESTDPSVNVVTLKYSGTPQTGTVEFVDGSGTVVKQVQVSGNTGDNVVLTDDVVNTAQDLLNNGYSLVDGSLNTASYGVFGADNSQNIFKITLAKNIDYVVTPVDSAGNAIKTLTGVPETGVAGDQVVLPDIPGYTAKTDPDIPATDGAVNVVYTPNSQNGTVNFVDDTGALLDYAKVVGVTDGHVDASQYAATEQALITAGYTPASGLTNTAANGTFAATGDSVFTIELTKPATSVNYTVTPIDEAGKSYSAHHDYDQSARYSWTEHSSTRCTGIYGAEDNDGYPRY